MKTVKENVKQKKRLGRPPGRSQSSFIGLRLSPELLAAIDGWIQRQPKPQPNRSEALRRLLSETLESGTETIQGGSLTAIDT
jgi:metal-responsive CopG/Arc/MetJ family transcriptional regulator